ncbi:hypothetical protein Prudu_021135 [Prunus dulcis]|uniref:Uncharacterized protein n=1 Tax=Prunus dulcis TaxID=3755 RepID=A0A4Y1RY64_PRUDU|nr:hypothetical protein Prudu_021135 [Prunus dulcis]
MNNMRPTTLSNVDVIDALGPVFSLALEEVLMVMNLSVCTAGYL